jgi:hypothetical protein
MLRPDLRILLVNTLFVSDTFSAFGTESVYSGFVAFIATAPSPKLHLRLTSGRKNGI